MLLDFTVCQSNQWWPQVYTIWNDPALKPSCFPTISHFSPCLKVLLPLLPLLGRCWQRRTHSFVIPHFELIFLLEMPKITLPGNITPRFTLSSDNTWKNMTLISPWGRNRPSLNLSHYNPRQMNLKFPNSFSGRTGCVDKWLLHPTWGKCYYHVLNIRHESNNISWAYDFITNGVNPFCDEWKCLKPLLKEYGTLMLPGSFAKIQGIHSQTN